MKYDKSNRDQNAIILAAGYSSRFAPLSYEKPKALIEVKGEILIERQIAQLQEAGIDDITIVVGYKHEMFEYLKEMYSVSIVFNDEYYFKNNISSLFKVKGKLKNTYICSADNYFSDNVFLENNRESFYSSIFVNDETDEWCMDTDKEGNIVDVNIGGKDAWIMIGHAYFSDEFSEQFKSLLIEAYNKEGSEKMLWEHLYIQHLEKLKMKIKKYADDVISEFDSLEELRRFDESYMFDSRSEILKDISKKLGCPEGDIVAIRPITVHGETEGFRFKVNDKEYKFTYSNSELRSC